MSECKTCTDCGKTKSLGEFNKSARTKDGYQYRCKECKGAYVKKNLEATLDRKFQRLYGIGWSDYCDMLSSQSGGCAICGRSPKENNGKRLSIDHDHETGKVRGLLCNRCNRCLGLLQDNPALTRRATVYLEAVYG